ncbi:kelch-like protein 12 [Haliotis asinina]|uniref:kelch-like protein 12 n=1 Tax=Haliotis asinina TaxID=109174 RepID=UPI0035324EA1
MPPGKHNNFVIKESNDGHKITNKTISQKTLTGLSEFWKSRELCDVTISINGEELPAHRLVLALNSDYFRAMFTAGFQESQSGLITMDNLKMDAVRRLVEYMYSGILTVTRDNVQDLLVSADILQMSDIKTICCGFIEKEIDASNCLGILEFAESFACTELKVKCVQLVKLRFPVVSKTEEFLALKTEALIRILQYEDLCLGFSGEAVVLEAIVSWMEHDPMSRIPDLPDILKYVRLQCIPDSHLNRFKNSAVVMENPDVRLVIENQLNSTGSIQDKRKAVKFIYTIGGYLQSRTGPLCPRLRSVECYDLRQNSWDNVENIPILASSVQAFNIYGRLFCTAFELTNSPQINPDTEHAGFFEYDTLQNKWHDATECFSSEAVNVLHDCLRKSGAITLCPSSNKLYTVTEADVKCVHIELEDGDLACRRVETMPQIDFFKSESDCRSNYAAVVCQGNLYVIGGDERFSQMEIFPSAIMCMFDPTENKWVTRASMMEPRARFDAVEMNGYIYAVGGFNNRRLRSVERYDPRSNSWTYVAAMNKERSHLRAVVHDGKIFAMGGKSYSFRLGGARKVLNSCEVYNPTTDTWTFTQPMKQARCMFGAVVL